MVKAIWHDAEVMAAIVSAENRIVDKACSLITDKIKASMKPGSYRKYPSKRGDGSWHWSSEPGTPPAPDTVALKDSISYATSGGKTGGLGPNSEVPNVSIPSASASTGAVGNIGTQDAVGLWQELGTKLNSDQRPFLRPAVLNSDAEISAAVEGNQI